jgi:hypothetical protein
MPQRARDDARERINRIWYDRQEIERVKAIEAQLEKAEDTQISLTDPDARSMQGTGKATGTASPTLSVTVTSS